VLSFRLQFTRDADGVAVVVAEEHTRAREHGSPIETFGEITFRRAAIAEVTEHDLIESFVVDGVTNTCGMWNLRRDRHTRR
jgi:hypothetical protein